MPIVERFCQELVRFPAEQAFLVGLSGGVDSVVLLHLLHHTRPNKLQAIHVHHGLSPNADYWATFCEQLCQQLAIPFQLVKVQLNNTHHNLEQQARQLRYQAVQQAIKHNEIFVTAHHLDDQAETFLLALKRGSGVKGLGAMQAVSFWQNFAIFRPLLPFSKTELISYAKQNDLDWIEDESNLHLRFDRNFLRNAILPALNQRWAFNQMVARSAKHCAEQEMLLAELLNEQLATLACPERKSLNIQHFPHYSTARQKQLIRLWLASLQQPMPNTCQMEQILNQFVASPADKNPQFVLNQYTMLRRYQAKIYLTATNLTPIQFEATLLPDSQLTLPEQLGEVQRQQRSVFLTKNAKQIEFTLPEQLNNQPIQLRFQAPSRVQEWGNAHHEEMKKVWQRYNVPVWLRKRTPLLFWQNYLVAVLPHFVS